MRILPLFLVLLPACILVAKEEYDPDRSDASRTREAHTRTAAVKDPVKQEPRAGGEGGEGGVAVAPEWVRALTGHEAREPLPPALEDLVFPEGEAVSLEWLVLRWQALAGVDVTYSESNQTQLRKRTLVPPASGRVSAANVQAFVQALLRDNDLYLVDLVDGGPSLLALMDSVDLTTARKQRFVPAEALAGYSDQHALLISTTLRVPTADTRQLSNSLRALLTDTRTQTLLAVGDDGILLEGPASWVAQVASSIGALADGGR